MAALSFVRQIAKEPASVWDLDAHNYADHADEVLALSKPFRTKAQVSPPRQRNMIHR
jgi:hypothetical protein